jgi:hydrophobic/amphiphilic exporter-1 (mainly G- bacteria), HAE1 family
MAQFFIRRPIVAMVIAIVTVVVGLVTLSRLPIAEYPQVSPTLIEATTTYRGAAAEAVMDSVATPIESKVNGVDKMLYLQSFSANDGKMILRVTFGVGTNVDIIQVNTQNRVSQAIAQLPDAVKREGVTVNRSSPDLLMVLGLYSPKGSYDAIFLATMRTSTSWIPLSGSLASGMSKTLRRRTIPCVSGWSPIRWQHLGSPLRMSPPPSASRTCKRRPA